jgi:type I restriction enzyme M protein
MLGGVVSMPSNIFATTGTNVSILFIDATNKSDVILIDASNLGEKVKEGKNTKTILQQDEEERIIRVFNTKESVPDFSVLVSYEAIKAKNYSLSAGQFFDVKIEHTTITEGEFNERLAGFQERIGGMFDASRSIEKSLKDQLSRLQLSHGN